MSWSVRVRIWHWGLRLAERLRQNLAKQTIQVGSVSLQVTVSIGVSQQDATTATANEVMRRADAALYRAERHGRNRVSGLTLGYSGAQSAKIKKPRNPGAFSESKRLRSLLFAVGGCDVQIGQRGKLPWNVIETLMPQSELKGLIVELRSATSGTAGYTAEFDHMAELAGRLADEVIKSHGARAA